MSGLLHSQVLIWPSFRRRRGVADPTTHRTGRQSARQRSKARRISFHRSLEATSCPSARSASESTGTGAIRPRSTRSRSPPSQVEYWTSYRVAIRADCTADHADKASARKRVSGAALLATGRAYEQRTLQADQGTSTKDRRPVTASRPPKLARTCNSTHPRLYVCMRVEIHTASSGHSDSVKVMIYKFSVETKRTLGHPGAKASKFVTKARYYGQSRPSS